MKTNVFELIKDRIKRMDKFHRQQILVYFLMFGFVIGETYVLIRISIISGEYSKELITLEEYIALQNDILVFALVYMVMLCLGMIWIYYWMKLLQVEYEKDQLIQDSKECVIVYLNDEFKYLIQCDPGNSTEVNSRKALLSLLEHTELFQSLYYAYKKGVTTFTIDDSNILKEMFEKEAEVIAPKMKKIQDVGDKN